MKERATADAVIRRLLELGNALLRPGRNVDPDAIMIRSDFIIIEWSQQVVLVSAFYDRLKWTALRDGMMSVFRFSCFFERKRQMGRIVLSVQRIVG